MLRHGVLGASALRVLCRSLVLLAGGTTINAGVGAQADVKTTTAPSELVVHFSGGLVSSNFATTIVDLAAAGLIPLRVYVDRDGLTPQQILLKLNLLPVETVAPEFDRYLCSINAHVCTVRNGHGVWTNEKAPPDAAVTSTLCPDRRLPDYALCLPQLDVRSFTSVSKLKYTAGVDEPLGAIVTSRTEGCARWDERCTRLVAGFNPGVDWNAKGFSGELLLPARRVTLRLPVGSPDHLTRLTKVLDLSAAKLTKAGQTTAANPRIVYAVPNAAMKGGGGSPVPMESPADSRDVLLKMKYPYATAAEIDKVHLRKVTVGIWDNPVDGNHCDFLGRGGERNPFMKPPDNLPPDPNGPRLPVKVKACGEARVPSSFSEHFDHGTFVAGLIAARENGVGVVGADPRATIWAFEYAKDRFVNNDPIVRIASEHGPPDIVNLSLQDELLRTVRSELELMVEQYRSVVLYVVAAGNNGATVSAGQNCPFVPGCFSTIPALAENVVSVVALAADGESPLEGAHATNRGTAFDVAAVGVATSTLYGDSTGEMDGTSVAAPFVSGLAALLKAQSVRTSLAPATLRQRILYTADFSEQLDEIARFGRINFARALATARDSTTFKPNRQPGVDGSRQLIKQGESIVINEAVQNGVELPAVTGGRPLPLTRLRRLAFDSASGKYWVVFVDELGALQKYSKVVFAANSFLRYRGGPATQVNLTDVQDFTCALDCK